MKNVDRKGQMAIRPGNEHQEPAIVYISDVNGHDMLICRVLNSKTTVFSDPNGEDLMDVDHDLFERLAAEWAVNNAVRALENARERLSDCYARQADRGYSPYRYSRPKSVSIDTTQEAMEKAKQVMPCFTCDEEDEVFFDLRHFDADDSDVMALSKVLEVFPAHIKGRFVHVFA